MTAPALLTVNDVTDPRRDLVASQHVQLWSTRIWGPTQWLWQCKHPDCPDTGVGGRVLADTQLDAFAAALEHVTRYAEEVTP